MTPSEVDIAERLTRLFAKDAKLRALHVLNAVREGDKRPTRAEIDEALRLTGDLAEADDGRI